MKLMQFLRSSKRNWPSGARLDRINMDKLAYQRLEVRQLLASLHSTHVLELAASRYDGGVEFDLKNEQNLSTKNDSDRQRASREFGSRSKKNENKNDRHLENIQFGTIPTASIQSANPISVPRDSAPASVIPSSLSASDQLASQAPDVTQTQGPSLAGTISPNEPINSNIPIETSTQFDPFVQQFEQGQQTQLDLPPNPTAIQASPNGNTPLNRTRRPANSFADYFSASPARIGESEDSKTRLVLSNDPNLSASEPTMLIGEIKFDPDVDFDLDDYLSVFEQEQGSEINLNNKLVESFDQSLGEFRRELASLMGVLAELEADPVDQRAQDASNREPVQPKTHHTRAKSIDEPTENVRPQQPVNLDEVSDGGMVMLGIEDVQNSDEIDQLIEFLADGMHLEIPISTNQIEMSVGVVQGFDVGPHEPSRRAGGNDAPVNSAE